MTRIAVSLFGNIALTDRLWQAGLLALAGIALVFVAGFAHPELVHNAAHDARHAFATPCH
jgi:cobalt transporter subunit CbtB